MLFLHCKIVWTQVYLWSDVWYQFCRILQKEKSPQKKTQTLEYPVELSGAENYKTNKMPSLNWDSTSIYVLLSRINMSHIYQNICPVSIIYIFDRLWGGINSQSLEDILQKYTLDKYTLERASSLVHHSRCFIPGASSPVHQPRCIIDFSLTSVWF